MDLIQAVNTPLELTLAGKSYQARALELREWGPVQAFLIRKVPGPLARVAASLQQLRDAGQSIDTLTEEILLDHAQREQLKWPPRVGSTVWFAALDTDDGITELVFAALASTTPGLTRAQAEELARSMSAAELKALVDLAVYGKHSDPKVPAPTCKATGEGQPWLAGVVRVDPIADVDEWGPLMFACLKDYAIPPWDFGRLTWPWLRCVLDKGKVPAQVDQALVKQAIAMAQAAATEEW